MLSNTFSTIVSNATAEIQYRHAVQTLEGVKSDAIFAYQPPFNILALFVLVPLRWVVSPRWFHKVHVFFVRLLNLPLLLIIAAAERRVLPWPPGRRRRGHVDSGGARPSGGGGSQQWFWEKWRITAHGDIHAVFEMPPPDEVEEAISVDDELTHHMIRRHFQRSTTAESATLQELIRKRKQNQQRERKLQQQQQEQQDQLQRQQQQQTQSNSNSNNNNYDQQRPQSDKGGEADAKSVSSQATRTHLGSNNAAGGSSSSNVGNGAAAPAPAPVPPPGPGRTISRRDSMAPFPGLRQELQGILTDSEEMSTMTARLDALEESNARIEAMLARLVSDVGDGDDDDDDDGGDEGNGGNGGLVDGGESAVSDGEEEAEAQAAGRTGTLRDLDRTAADQQ